MGLHDSATHRVLGLHESGRLILKHACEVPRSRCNSVRRDHGGHGRVRGTWPHASRGKRKPRQAISFFSHGQPPIGLRLPVPVAINRAPSP